jgi:hypothetical protein
MLRLDPVPSRSLRLFVWLAHAGALLAVGVSGIPPGYKAGLAVLLGVGCLLQQWCMRHPKIRTLEFRSDQGWQLGLSDGQTLAGRLLPGSSVRGKVAFLYFKTAKGLHSLLLMRDSVPQADYRKLRLLVRINPSGLLQTPGLLASKPPLRATSKVDPVV